MLIKPVYDRIVADGYFKTVECVQEVPDFKAIPDSELPACFMLQPKDVGGEAYSTRGRQAIKSNYQFYIAAKTTNRKLEAEPLITEARMHLTRLLIGFSVSGIDDGLYFVSSGIDLFESRITSWVCDFSTNSTVLPI